MVLVAELQDRLRFHTCLSTKNGRIFLNRPALATLGDPDSVALWYDKQQMIIRVQAVPPSRHYALRLQRSTRNGKGRTISATKFCRHHKIFPEETLAFLSPEINKDNILILDLNEVRSVKKCS